MSAVFTLESSKGERVDLCLVCYGNGVNNPRDSAGQEFVYVVRGAHHGECQQCTKKN